jgi:hypothetical protein
MTMGITKLKAGGSLGYGVLVGTDASGKGTTITSGSNGTVSYPKGIVVIGNTAANGIVSALIGLPIQRAF